MDFKEIKTKSAAELNALLRELKNKLADLRFKDAQKQVKNVREIRNIKKTIAQILTVLTILGKEQIETKK